MSSPGALKRRHSDVKKLIMRKFDITMDDESVRELFVRFQGPKDSAYEGGSWKVHVTLPENYPYKSPSIGFCNKIFHPNIDERSGSVCLDVINQTWSPMYDLSNIFDVFLPQLLLDPNPSDPLNGDAAAMLLGDKKKYYEHVRSHVRKYAPVRLGSMSTTEDDEVLDDVDEDDDEDFSDMDD